MFRRMVCMVFFILAGLILSGPVSARLESLTQEELSSVHAQGELALDGENSVEAVLERIQSRERYYRESKQVLRPFYRTVAQQSLRSTIQTARSASTIHLTGEDLRPLAQRFNKRGIIGGLKDFVHTMNALSETLNALDERERRGWIP